jgi:hypothetical protein
VNQKFWPIKLLPLLLLLLAPVMARAQFTYVTNDDNTITITGYTESDTNLIIPDTISGFPVTVIGDQAFSGDFNLESVTIPSSVLSIEHGAFNECSSLANVIMSDGVTNIGASAFVFCTSLTNLVIPDSVTTIGSQVFYDCSSLTNILLGSNVTTIASDAFYGSIGLQTINVNSNSLVYSSMGGVLFNKDQTTLVAYPGGPSDSYTTPPGVTTIGAGAFIDDTLAHVVISEGVTAVQDGAFFNCPNLMTVAIPGTVTNFGIGIFENCFALGSVVISNGVSSIGTNMFASCFSLTNVTIPYGVTNIGPAAFYGCGLSSIVIPDSVTDIGQIAFSGCPLVQVALPSGLNTIGQGAFGDCRLTSIIIPKNVTSIGYEAFGNCFSLTAVYFEGTPPTETGSFSPESLTAYYLPGTPGWGATYDGIPTAPWYLPNPSILTFEPFGIQTNAFVFTISWATNMPVIVDACTNLSNPDWQPVQTNTLAAGTAYFSDPQWASYSSRFYRLRSP